MDQDRMTAAELQAMQQTRRASQASSSPRRRIEDAIQAAIIEYLELVLPGCIIHHSPNELDMSGRSAAWAVAKAKHRGMIPGWPDLDVRYRGRSILLEVKSSIGSLTQTQRDVHARLREQGQLVAVVRSIEDVRQVLAELGLATMPGGRHSPSHPHGATKP